MTYRSNGIRVLTAMVFGAAIFVSAATGSALESPKDFVRKKSHMISDLLNKPASERRAESFSDKAEKLIDFRELAKRALGKYWDQQSKENRDEFLSLLKRLLEANYKSKIEGEEIGEDYTIEYGEVKTRGDKAYVKTTVRWGEGEEKVKPVGYKLLKKDGEWVVYDLIIDDISLEESYRESYQKIIREEGWSELISRMKEKIDELEGKTSEEAASGGGGK